MLTGQDNEISEAIAEHAVGHQENQEKTYHP
jgi:hypothetical protein